MRKQIGLKAWLQQVLQMCQMNGFNPRDLDESENIEFSNLGIQVSHALIAWERKDFETVIMTLPHVGSAASAMVESLEGDHNWEERFQDLKQDVDQFVAGVPKMQLALRKKHLEGEDK